MEYPKDFTGKTVKPGDMVRGEGFLRCQGGFRIDLTPIVTVREKEGVLYFGWLSAKSFSKFFIVNQNQIEYYGNQKNT